MDHEFETNIYTECERNSNIPFYTHLFIAIGMSSESKKY